MYSRKRKHSTNKTRKHSGGRLLSYFRVKSAKTTKGEMKDIIKQIDAIKLKDVKSDVDSKINSLEKLRESCIAECTSKCTDDKMCMQLRDMIRTKPENEWAGLCSNSLSCKTCKAYMKEYMGLQIEANYLEDVLKHINDQLKKYESNLHSRSLKTKTTKKTKQSKSSVMNPMHQK
jgi:hypothetical protein